VQVLCGRTALAAMRPTLAELSRRTGQAAAMDSLEHLLNAPATLGKVPYLILVATRPGVDAENPSAAEFHGAVVLHEYQFAGVGTRVFSTHDLTGQHTVFAPAGIRTLVAEAACHALLQRGALIALISLEASSETAPSPSPGPQYLIATRMRTLPRDLRVEATLDATLAHLGKRTRRNLRYYRRRAEADLGATFVPCVEIGREAFLAMNRTSTNPAPESDAAWRYQCIGDLPGSMFAGVRAADGRWLSLIGGRRYEGITGIAWQMNRAGFPRYSLSTVMRSCLIEHEVALGTAIMSFEGGTTHSMRHALIGSDVRDILVVRRSPLARLVRQFATHLFPESNFLRKVLRDKDLVWSQ
jgi:hypothetical protein